MHILRTERRSLDETAQAVDLDHSPADLVCLSFTDSDLAVLAAGHDAQAHPTLRLASLGSLKHPYSIDLYVDKVCAKARFVLVRLLGGLDYWRYGVDELAAAARRDGFHLAIIPGDTMDDPRLDEASTLEQGDLRRLWAYFQEGGPENLAACLSFIAAKIGGATEAPSPRPVELFGLYAPACVEVGDGAARALIVFYRSAYLAADTAPVLALAQALATRGLAVLSVYVSSLKDPAVAISLKPLIEATRPDVVLNITAFSARLDDGAGVLDAADAVVLQVILAGSDEAQWVSSARGLGAADLAMNVVLPEIDGRIVTRAISFKAEGKRDDKLEFTRLAHRPHQSRVDFVAALAAMWASLRRKPKAQKKLALILSDYPAKGGRTGYAVGLDTPQSALKIAGHLAAEGYSVGALPKASDLIAALSSDPNQPVMTLEAYEERLRTLPKAFIERVAAAWGDPCSDPALSDGAFQFRFERCGNLIMAVQPDRGRFDTRKGDYHDTALAPRHAYIAFYLWLRETERLDALVHCGAHGTLEWLPGKSVALSEDCAPEAVLGPMPLVYPFIVNNPGEAAQAKRRTAAVVIGHLTPPLIAAGSHGATAEIEALFDEYAEAQSLDPRRAAMLADLILSRASESGLLEECGAREGDDALFKLDAWLCDLKDMRIADGLHVFGRSPEGDLRAAAIANLEALDGAADASIADNLDSCGTAELDGLVRALDGRFVQPGPAGAPMRGRRDVLPTGRNLYTIDPRAAPTRTAWEIGRRTAAEVLTRYTQDHGEWPRRIMLDLWGSATMRTGGDDLAQAFALMGVRPLWDNGSTRVSGFEILSLASLGRPRVDVTLRISGLFRDVFPMQIALFDAAVRAIAALDESADENPLAGTQEIRRVFGAAPGHYGVGLGARLARGEWRQREELAQAYLAATSHAYGAAGFGEAAGAAFAASVASADAFVHVQDMPGQDVLDSDAFAEHEGGFAAAAALLDNEPAVYHADATSPDAARVRTMAEEIARVLRARATNPRWLRGQMRHGHRGAAEIAETVDNLFAYAALTDAVPSRHFDLLFEATCGDETLRAFLESANPQAAAAIAAKFEEAARRGFWISRRNSSAAILAEMRSVA
jgi:cobaltochelatase CobN